MVTVEKRSEPLTRPQQRTALDLVFALLAVAGMTFSVFADLPVRTSAFAASDFKTLYASAWCFRHGMDAYSFPNLQAVFQAQSIVLPASWFGHAPVYPPATLAILAPLTFAPLLTASYLVTAASALLFAFAVAALVDYGAGHFTLGLRWRLAIIALCAAGPLLAFALSMGNLSVAASALVILGFVHRDRGSPWVSSTLLALALLLKPHLAVWMLLGMLLLPNSRSRGVALRAAALGLAVGLGAAEALAPGRLLEQTRACLAMLAAEMAPGGSMNLSSHEALPVLSQITSLRSLLGFWTPHLLPTLLCAAPVLAVTAALLAWRTHRVQDEPEACLALTTWCAVGMLTTYHRAHDAIVLLLLLPWLANQLRARTRQWQSWALLALYALLSAGPSVPWIGSLVASAHPFLAFLVLRQAALAQLALTAVLLSLLFRAQPRFTATHAR